VLPLERLTAADLRLAIVSYLEVLRAHRERINALNVYPIPDADTGTNMTWTVDAVVGALEGATDMRSTAEAIARGALAGGRGISGIVLSQLLRTFAERAAGLAEIDARSLAEALAAASEAARAALSRPVEGTILTVAREAAEAAIATSSEGGSLVEVLDAARTAAERAVARTPELLPALRQAGVVDAGGTGLALLFDALLHVVDGRALPVVSAGPPASPQRWAGDADGPRYELTCLLDAPERSLLTLREGWAATGDSIVVVGSEGAWRCHVHTGDPEAAIAIARSLGDVRDIRVTDLAVQIAQRRGVRGVEVTGLPDEPVATAVVAVGEGDGVRILLRSLGAQRVVPVGASGSPSVGELLEAIEEVPAREVAVLPNDPNVVPAAERAGTLTSKSVRVVPTGGLAGALAALHAYDPQAGLDENAERMGEAAAAVRSGEIARAARDSTCALGPIREGDWIGISPDGIGAVGADVAETAEALLDRLVDEESDVVTLIEGEGSSDEVTDRIVAWLARHRPGVGVQVLYGGQPFRAYVLGVE
jgi:hypothetical protein